MVINAAAYRGYCFIRKKFFCIEFGQWVKSCKKHSTNELKMLNFSRISSSLYHRPSRKTKQVAEVYLELMSQRLAKESQKTKDLSDEDMEEDNISISSIKELKALTKSCSSTSFNF